MRSGRWREGARGVPGAAQPRARSEASRHSDPAGETGKRGRDVEEVPGVEIGGRSDICFEFSSCFCFLRWIFASVIGRVCDGCIRSSGCNIHLSYENGYIQARV